MSKQKTTLKYDKLYYSKKEVRKYLGGCSLSHVNTLMKLKVLKVKRFGRLVRMTPEQIEDCIELCKDKEPYPTETVHKLLFELYLQLGAKIVDGGLWFKLPGDDEEDRDPDDLDEEDYDDGSEELMVLLKDIKRWKEVDEGILFFNDDD